MLKDHAMFPTLPASELDRARAFYSEKLGLTPSQVLPGGDLEYECSGTRFYVTKSVGKSPGEFTQASWAVQDVDAEVAGLRSRGVIFEEYDLPEMKTVDGIAIIPELGRAAYFRDSEGNLLGMIQFA